MQFEIYLSLGIYFLAMLAIGVYAYRVTTQDMSGYMLGGRNLSPSVTALSAGASDMSGWLLMGLPGAMFVTGISGAWIGVGLIIGAYLNYLLVAPRLRAYTEMAGDAVTIPQFFANRFEDNSHLIRAVSSIVIIVFFAVYTTSGVVAGGKLFETALGLNYELGLYVTAGVVVAYTVFGGFLAVSTTDFVQGCIMFVALIMVPVVTLMEVGGLGTAMAGVRSIDPELLNIFRGMTVIGIISTMSWGLGYFGQPHIIVRFMAIRSVPEIKLARRIGMSWMLVALVGALATGLFGAFYVKTTGANLQDPETIFIFLSTVLFHPLIGGFLLAAILAAVMSTISSQLLVTSSSLTGDFYHTFLRRGASPTELVTVGRLSVVLVAALAVFMAQDRNSTILTLVSHAWAGFGAAFGPVVVLSLFWRRMTRQGALAGIIAGAVTVLIWVYAPLGENGASLSLWMYEMVPGFCVGLLAIVSVSLLSPSPSKSIIAKFEEVQTELEHA